MFYKLLTLAWIFNWDGLTTGVTQTLKLDYSWFSFFTSLKQHYLAMHDSGLKMVTCGPSILYSPLKAHHLLFNSKRDIQNGR